MPKVSIIVPIFNEEKRVEKCIKSIQGQTFTDIEIIAVDDGSTDKTHDILSRLKYEDSRIHIIQQANGGTGADLNAGLSQASGEFIGFSGADDWLNETMVELLFNSIIEQDSDLAVCNIQKHSHGLSHPVLNLTIRHECN